MSYAYSVNAACIEGDAEDFRFINSLPDDPVQEKDILTFLAGAEVHIKGRTPYERPSKDFQGKTSTDDPFAPIYAATDKVVLSCTLASADWERTTIDRGDLVPEVEKLKREGNGYIIVTGRSGITRTLLQHDLVDELRMSVFPMLLGQGFRMFNFDDVGTSKEFELISCEPGTNGVVVRHYRRHR
jgi:dihydrofolate reductase